MQRQKTKIYKFPLGTAVVISTPLHRDHGTRGVIEEILDPMNRATARDILEEDRAPRTGEVQYTVLIKNTQTKAQFLAEDEDNEADDWDEFEVVGPFYASDLRRDGF